MARDILGETAPSSLEAEEALLGAILLDPETALPNALETGLRPDDFFQEAHAEIFRACLKLDSERQPVDQVTTADALKSRGTLEKCGGPAYLARLYDGIGLAASAGRYARIIIDRAILRRLISLSGVIAQRSQGSPPEVEDLLDWAESEILKVRSERRADSFINAAEKIEQEIFPAILDWKDKRRDGLALPGLPSGYDALDKLTGGLQRSDLIILAARPGLGKTSLALNLALNAAIPSQRQTYRQLPPATVAIFSLEMDHKQLLLRLVCQVGRLDLKNLRTGWTADDDILPLTEAVTRLGQARIYIDDTPALRVLELRAKARRLKSQLQSQGLDLDLVVVDYLQLMRGNERRSLDSREQEISEISRSLKSLAKELHLPVLALSQLNRDMEKRSGKDKKPRLSDLRESGAIEQDADLIAFIHCPERGDSDDHEQGQDRQAELLISKHRNGPTGEVPLYFKASSATFLPGQFPQG
ncbi:MAG: replicative DNA helicase [Candidatus Adiutrix sp.]|jgi:replicative DNA helicase|nr:replicative DNA helicase [Candidatus Adiutrix sp.]